METTFSKVLVLQNGLSHVCLPIGFLSNILWLLPNIQQNCIFGAKIPESLKICQTMEAFAY